MRDPSPVILRAWRWFRSGWSGGFRCGALCVAMIVLVAPTHTEPYADPLYRNDVPAILAMILFVCFLIGAFKGYPGEP